MGRAVSKSSTAESTPFDNASNGFAATNTQAAIDELALTGGDSASPGFTWGKSGTVSSGTWLHNESVPSNTTGRNFSLYNGKIIQLTLANEEASTCTIEIYEHDGVTFTLLTSMSLVSQRSKTIDVSGVTVTRNKELAAKVSSGSLKNPVVQVIAKGTKSP